MSAFDLLGVNATIFNQMMEGVLRPSIQLNSTLSYIINKSIGETDKALQDALKPYINGQSKLYKLNGSLAMFSEIKRYYELTSQNRSVVLLEKLKEMKFIGSSLSDYNSEYLHIFQTLLTMGEISDTGSEVKNYIDSLGNDKWVENLQNIVFTLPKELKNMKNVTELALEKFLAQYKDGNRNQSIFKVQRKQNEQRFQYGFRNNNSNNYTNNYFRSQTGFNTCKNCGNSHVRGECPAFGKTCSNCGKLNHLSSVCFQLPVNRNRLYYNYNQSPVNIQQPQRINKVENPDYEVELENRQYILDPWVKSLGNFDENHMVIVDSGASLTLTHVKGALDDFKEIQPFQVYTAGNPILLSGVGTYTLNLSFGEFKIRCYYSSDSNDRSTMISVKEFKVHKISTMFIADPDINYLSLKGQRHYLREFNNSYVLSIKNKIEDINSFDTWYNWHKSMGHSSYTIMKYTFGDKLKISEKDAICDECSKATSTIQSYKIHKNQQRLSIDFRTLYADYKVLRNGYILHLLFRGWLELYFIKQKPQAVDCIFDFLSKWKFKPNQFVADEDTPFKDYDFKIKMKEKGIPVNLIPPHKHQLNHVEPRIRYSMARIRAIILQIPDIHPRFQDTIFTRIVKYVAFMINRTGPTPVPYTQMFKQIPDISLFKAFYSECYIPELDKSNNLKPQAIKVHFLGYSEDSVVPTCLLWNPSTNQIVKRAFIDCKWARVEDKSPQSLSIPERTRTEEANIKDLFSNAFKSRLLIDDNNRGSPNTADNVGNSNESQSTNTQEVENTEITTIESNNETILPNLPAPKFQSWASMVDEDLHDYGSKTDDLGQRQSRRHQVKAILMPEDVSYAYELPKASDEVREIFTKPILKEVENVFNRNVVKIIPEVPENALIIKSQLILNIKRNGTVKARWVARGDQQGELYDEDKYAPTINRRLVLLLLHLAQLKGLIKALRLLMLQLHICMGNSRMIRWFICVHLFR